MARGAFVSLSVDVNADDLFGIVVLCSFGSRCSYFREVGPVFFVTVLDAAFHRVVPVDECLLSGTLVSTDVAFSCRRLRLLSQCFPVGCQVPGSVVLSVQARLFLWLIFKKAPSLNLFSSCGMGSFAFVTTNPAVFVFQRFYTFILLLHFYAGFPM